MPQRPVHSKPVGRRPPQKPIGAEGAIIFTKEKSMFTRSTLQTVFSAIDTARYVMAQGRLDCKRFWVYILVPVATAIYHTYFVPAERIANDIVAPALTAKIDEIVADCQAPQQRPTATTQPAVQPMPQPAPAQPSIPQDEVSFAIEDMARVQLWLSTFTEDAPCSAVC